jgi:hypothetical protein
VAGVGYAVAYPSGTALRAPSALSMPGVVLNASAQTITISASNVTLDSYDFSVNGGWTVNIVAAANVSIKNCKFVLTSAFGSIPAIASDSLSPGLYI